MSKYGDCTTHHGLIMALTFLLFISVRLTQEKTLGWRVPYFLKKTVSGLYTHLYQLIMWTDYTMRKNHVASF